MIPPQDSPKGTNRGPILYGYRHRVGKRWPLKRDRLLAFNAHNLRYLVGSGYAIDIARRTGAVGFAVAWEASEPGMAADDIPVRYISLDAISSL